MKTEILISCLSESWGGLEIMALEHVKQLKKQGFNTSLLCSENSPLSIISKENGIHEIIEINIKHKFSAINNLRKTCRKVKIIHSHHSHDLWLLVPALKLGRSKALLYLTKHLASGVNKKDIFHRILYGRVNKIFAISEFIKDNVNKTCPVEQSDVILLHNGIDTAIFNRKDIDRNKIRSELGIGHEKTAIGMVGRITPGKGHYEFAEAAQLINKIKSEEVVYLIAGSSSPGEEHIESDIKRVISGKGIRNIIYTGFRTDIERIMTALDILVFPSHDESFGITLLEAMAMEVPVIASNNSGIPDIIPSDEYGVLVPPKNSATLADGILKLINDAGLRKKLAINGRLRVEEKFNSEKIIKELIKYYYSS